MSSRRRKRFDPFDYAMENVRLSAGVSLGSMLVEEVNVQTGSHVNTGPAMTMLGTLPMLHATKGMFMSLEDLNKRVRKR